MAGKQKPQTIFKTYFRQQICWTHVCFVPLMDAFARHRSGPSPPIWIYSCGQFLAEILIKIFLPKNACQIVCVIPEMDLSSYFMIQKKQQRTCYTLFPGFWNTLLFKGFLFVHYLLDIHSFAPLTPCKNKIGRASCRERVLL